ARLVLAPTLPDRPDTFAAVRVLGAPDRPCPDGHARRGGSRHRRDEVAGGYRPHAPGAADDPAGPADRPSLAIARAPAAPQRPARAADGRTAHPQYHPLRAVERPAPRVARPPPTARAARRAGACADARRGAARAGRPPPPGHPRARRLR